ncbi:hypothetical protein QBC38DRAFT_517271 [Podospora fimiseda]|uniref:CCHC-type domain-containing protein n=1 Tax=Podospora fimiseda TaxID=252190 RepID=A0AAN7BH54_9PEZI|nr:hypothetical protein QBC38DRAFT_517271 [Podospora fimiseda]
MYGEPDEEKAAEDRLERLAQTTLTSANATLLHRDTFRVNWADTVLKNKFYRGVKPKVKDELIKKDRHAFTLDEYINKAIIIDNRIFERSMEDKGVYRNPQVPKTINTPKKCHPNSTSYGTDSRPMDIGAAQHSQTPQGRYGSKRKDKSKVTCFNCDRLGHYAREYRSPKNFKPVQFADTDRVVRMIHREDDDPFTG